MRVAVVTTSYPNRVTDAAGHFVRSEARALVRQGHRVTVFAPDAHAENDGIDVMCLDGGGAFGWPGAASRLRAQPLKLIGAARWMASARNALRHAGPFDAVIAHWAVPSGLVAIDAHYTRSDAPFELVSHGGDVRLLLGLPARVRERVVAPLASRATTWRFVSEGLRADMLGALSPPLARRLARIAEVSPCVLELPDVRARSLEIRRQARRPMVCSVSRLVPSKGVDRVLEYARRAHEDKRVIVIGDGPERRSLERLAEKHALDATFMGTLPREEALAWMAASEALLFASQAEGHSTVLREAEALGVRVERAG